MRFLDFKGGKKTPSPSLLDVGVEAAIRRSGFDEEMFFQRGGKYTWSKSEMPASQFDWWLITVCYITQLAAYYRNNEAR